MIFSTISEEAKRLMENIKQIDDLLDTTYLTVEKTKYDFNSFTFLSKLTLKIYCHDLTLQEVQDD